MLGSGFSGDRAGAVGSRRFPVRYKLVVVLALPGLALLVLAGVTVADARRSASRARVQSELALSTAGPQGLLRGLDAERNHTSARLLGTEGTMDLPHTSLDEARAAVDEALAAFDAEVQGAGREVHEAYEPALASLDGLREIRSAADAAEAPGRLSFANSQLANDLFGQYSGLIDELFAAGERAAVKVDDPDLRHGGELINLATQQLDTRARLVRALVRAQIAASPESGGQGLDQPEERRQVETLLAELRSRQETIEINAVGRYVPHVERLLGNESVAVLAQHAETALESGRVEPGDVLMASTPEGFGYDDLLDAVSTEVSDAAETATSRTAGVQRNYTILGVLVVGMVIAVAWLVSRSITRPLRSLTEQATRMAEEELPRAVSTILQTTVGATVTTPALARVEVSTRDEVGDVAVALNTVQDAAVGLAMEQALLRRNVADALVHLGRRNHDLLGRQLAFITDLEREETDADALANLFRLDHMATRMRRNAESLLVLAGRDLPRLWTTPIKVIDVIRAALGEVEDYQRVSARAVDAAAVEGSAASSLAHLLAELIENALTFSPPGSVIEVTGVTRPDGYVIRVTDAGAGMGPAELERANRRLAGAESFMVAPSEYLGHYVTGQLASRHGIAVWLEPRGDGQPAGGTTAVVRLPASLVFRAPTQAAAASLRPAL